MIGKMNRLDALSRVAEVAGMGVKAGILATSQLIFTYE